MARPDARPSARLALLLLAAAVLAGAPGSPRAGEREELEALRDEVRREREALAAEREELAAQRERVEAALSRLVESEGGAAPPPVSEGPSAQLEVYGFIHADAIYDANRVDPDWSATLRPSKIPVVCPGDPGCGNDGEVVLSARQSRFGVRGLAPTPLGEVKTRFEFELFGVGDDAGETTFRLRHAWGELGRFGAGQTWSLFMDPDVFPNTIDYWGPVGMVFLRNPQVRWTPWEREGLRAALAIESPSSALDQGKVETSQIGGDLTSWNQFPDATAHVRFEQEWGHVQLAGILRGLGFEVRTNPGKDPDDQVLGAGGNLSGTFRLFEGDKILWQVAGGEGIANYMNDGGTDLAPNGALDEAQAVPFIGWLLYYNRQWSERWTSSLGYSEHRQFTTGGQEDTAFETGQYANANVLFHPVPGVFLGPEFVWGRRENRDGADGTDARVQFSFHYDFGATILGGR